MLIHCVKSTFFSCTNIADLSQYWHNGPHISLAIQFSREKKKKILLWYLIVYRVGRVLLYNLYPYTECVCTSFRVRFFCLRSLVCVSSLCSLVCVLPCMFLLCTFSSVCSPVYVSFVYVLLRAPSRVHFCCVHSPVCVLRCSIMHARTRATGCGRWRASYRRSRDQTLGSP